MYKCVYYDFQRSCFALSKVYFPSTFFPLLYVCSLMWNGLGTTLINLINYWNSLPLHCENACSGLLQVGSGLHTQLSLDCRDHLGSLFPGDHSNQLQPVCSECVCGYNRILPALQDMAVHITFHYLLFTFIQELMTLPIPLFYRYQQKIKETPSPPAKES